MSLKKVGNVWKPVLNKISDKQLKQAVQTIQTKDENGLKQ
jgi:hypothetical protein